MQSRQVQNYKINKMTKAQYSSIVPSQDEVYITVDEADAVVSVNNILPDANGNVTIPTGGTVDQTYNPSSANAQSGVAINGAGFATQSWVTNQGYTTNTGTVTSVNNVQPVNGNVTITIPTVPTNVSAFTNDAGYITSSALSGYVPVSANSQTISATSGDFVINTYYSFQLNDTVNGTQPLLYDSSDEQLSLFKASGSPAVASFEGNTQNGNLTLSVEGDFNINTIDTGTALYVNSSKVLTAINVDQTYDGTSANPQSGVAIAGAGFLTGITSGDVTTALGYTPYNSSNPSGYTSNVGTVTSVNNVQPVNGNVTLSIPSVGNGTVTFTQGGVTKGSITMNQSGDTTIDFDAGGSGGIQNTATGTDSLTILGTPTTFGYAMNIGFYSNVTEDDSIAIGQGATVSGADSLGIGRDCNVAGDNSIQLGYGTLISDNTFQVWNYPLLDYQYGLIPDARLSSNIARTSQLTTPTYDSTNERITW